MMGRGPLMGALMATAAAAVLAVTPAVAEPGDADRGKAVYAKRCVLCHGVEGEGDGAAAERLVPPPRDFSEGLYKIKTTGFDDPTPNDADLFRMIRDGMPGSAMPGWSGMLSAQDMWDVVAYIKTFAGIEEEPSNQVDYGAQVATSADSVEAGRKLFLDRCSECHGEAGKGDGIKKLKNDAGARTWPRNLTKPWSFRASNQPKDIFTRVTVGIPSTQMPSFADPVSKKILTIEERWHVANYVASLAKTEEVVRPENTVIKAEKVEGEVPSLPGDPRWQGTEPSTFFLLPQIIAKERFFTPSNDTITVRALYSESEVALLLEWDDRTKSIPGDDKAKSIADPELAEDAIAVQLPMIIPVGMEKPYFLMGDAAKPVNLWRWSSGTVEKPESIALLDAMGILSQEARDATAAGLTAKGNYKAGTWQVVMTRPLRTKARDKDLQFEEGRFIPIAFFAWDGSNSEAGTSHAMTTWYWLLLKPTTGAKPIIGAVIATFLVGGILLWWGRTAAAKGTDRSA